MIIRDGTPNGQIETGLTQKDHRRWMRQHPGHRSFTVLRHPLTRAYDAFCRFILPPDIEAYADICHALRDRYDVPLPDGGVPDDWDAPRQSAAFLGFLKFLSGNLGGQTSLRVDYSWASQAAFLSAIAGFSVPDRVVREDTMEDELRQIAETVGLHDAPLLKARFSISTDFPLESVRTSEIDAACEAAYRRDYILFGFESWQTGGQAA